VEKLTKKSVPGRAPRLEEGQRAERKQVEHNMHGGGTTDEN